MISNESIFALGLLLHRNRVPQGYSPSQKLKKRQIRLVAVSLYISNHLTKVRNISFSTPNIRIFRYLAVLPVKP